MGKENKHRGAFAKFPPSPITKGAICSGLSQLRAHQPLATTRLVPCRGAERVRQRQGRGSSVGAAGNAEQVGEASLDVTWFWQHSWKALGLAQVAAPLCVARGACPGGV